MVTVPDDWEQRYQHIGQKRSFLQATPIINDDQHQNKEYKRMKFDKLQSIDLLSHFTD